MGPGALCLSLNYLSVYYFDDGYVLILDVSTALSFIKNKGSALVLLGAAETKITSATLEESQLIFYICMLHSPIHVVIIVKQIENLISDGFLFSL